jgi:hypothetical protein
MVISAEPHERQAMAGRHRRQPNAVHVRIPQQRRVPTIGIIDAHTRVEHRVNDESAAAHRHAGRYLALCGAEVLAASMLEPGRGQCLECLR